MKDVIVRLEGGLGNQMFQYAAARAVAVRSGADLVLDLSWFATQSDRRYSLAALNVTARTSGFAAPDRSVIACFLNKIAHKITKYTGRDWRGRPVFREKYFHFDPRVLGLRAPICMEGYFQSEKYFADCSKLITSEFALTATPGKSSQAMLEKIQASDAICLHVRRGDYVASATTNAFHGTCGLDYYHEGLRIVSEGRSSPHCFVFSDDPQWVRSNFQPALPMTVVDIYGPDEAHEDLRLITACKHFVIANSSLSWWGAWLGRYAGKRVVAPRSWFQGSANDTKDLIPEGWTTI